jgi:hypothetical protein
MISETPHGKFEIGAALVGAAVGAVGAVVASPIVLAVGAVVAAVATGMRVYDHGEKSRTD